VARIHLLIWINGVFRVRTSTPTYNSGLSQPLCSQGPYKIFNPTQKSLFIAPNQIEFWKHNRLLTKHLRLMIIDRKIKLNLDTYITFIHSNLAQYLSR